MDERAGSPNPAPVGPGGRILAVDAVRGLVMALMALDHGRDFLTASLASPTDPATTYAWLFFTRFVTHVCAPTFVLLTGLSMALSLARDPRIGRKAASCLARGLLCILLEVSLVSWAWGLGWGSGTVFMLQVIWVLGAGMALMAGLLFVPDSVKLAFGLVLVLGHNLLDGVTAASWGEWGWLWRLLHEPGRLQIGGMRGFVLYPLLPWIGVMPLGFVCGRLYGLAPKRRVRVLAGLSVCCLGLFLLLRLANGYGDPRAWRVFPEVSRTLYSFLDVTKYPPSLLFLLVTLAGTFGCLAFFERPRGAIGRVLSVYGRAPLFFYLAHLYLLHGLGLAYAWLTLGQANWAGDPIPRGAAPGAPLWLVYAVWLVAVALLYPACRRIGAYRAAHRNWWTSLL